MRHLLALVACAALLALPACGGGGAAPVVSDLKVTTAPVVRGQIANGTVNVADADGLSGLKLELAFSGPVSFTSEAAVQGTSDALLMAVTPFVFVLTPATPKGRYTLAVTAVDRDGDRSAPASVSFDAL